MLFRRGRGWGGGDVYFDSELQAIDPGVPVGACAPVPGKQGVFQRKFTKLVVTLDCPAWNATWVQLVQQE